MPAGSTFYPWLINSAIISLVILIIGSVCVLIWRQPARRVRIIELTLFGCLIAPLLGMIPGYPKLVLGWLDIESIDRQEGFLSPAAARAIGQTVPAGQESPAKSSAILLRPASETIEAPSHSLDIGFLHTVLYLLGVGLGTIWWLIGIVALAKIILTSRPAPGRCRELLAKIAGRRGARVRLMINQRLDQPCVAWFGRPMIILPENLCGDDQAMLWSLSHEWAHVERHDFQFWLLANFARVLFFYQPLVWWMRNQLRLCQDIVADMQAAGQSPQPADYAEFLTIRSAAGSLHPAIVGIGLGFHKSELYRRIVMLVQNQSLERRVPRLWTISATLTALVLIAVTSAISMLNSVAEEVKGIASDQQSAPTDQQLDKECLIMMGRVEDFFMHNYRDVTARKSLEWGKVETNKDGSQSIRYKYEARIWDKEILIINEVFTFDKQGNFVQVKKVEGFPKKKEPKKVDVTTKQGVIDLVEDFFQNNYRDVKSRKTIEWGDLEKQDNGNVSIRYKYSCKIWDKDAKIMNEIFTFDNKGEYVSVKDVEGFPQDAD